MRNEPPISYPKAGELWRHVKRGSEYIVVGTADRETSNLHYYDGGRMWRQEEEDAGRDVQLFEPGWDVVYVDRSAPDSTKLHTRDLVEFMDGRFERIVAPPPSEGRT